MGRKLEIMDAMADGLRASIRGLRKEANHDMEALESAKASLRLFECWKAEHERSAPPEITVQDMIETAAWTERQTLLAMSPAELEARKARDQYYAKERRKVRVTTNA